MLNESGTLPVDPEKQKLRRVNMVAILTAFEAIATGGYRLANPEAYESLPVNAGSAVDIVIMGARLVLPGGPPLLVDITLNYEDALKKGRARVREVGDLVATSRARASRCCTLVPFSAQHDLPLIF